MRKIAVVLLSGGLDSSTVAAAAVRQGYELKAFTVHYGQRHSKEVSCAREVARRLGIKHEVVDISCFQRLAWHSALTGPGVLAVPVDRRPEDMAQAVPATYVPLRNTVFIALAAAFLESEALHLIERQGVPAGQVEASLFIAANAVDYSGYPDCRPEYFDQVAKAIALGSKLGTTYGRPVRIETPIIGKSKADIVRMAVELGVPLECTWSCYEGGPAPCARCDSCLLRARGFAEAGLVDPLLAAGQAGGP